MSETNHTSTVARAAIANHRKALDEGAVLTPRPGSMDELIVQIMNVPNDDRVDSHEWPVDDRDH